MARFAAVAIAILLQTTSASAAGLAIPDPNAVIARTFSVERSHTRVQFTISHMGFANWRGHFAGTR